MSDSLKRKLGIWTATFAVFASMIGSGIFGNTGKVQEFVGDPLMVLFLWFFYGLVAIAGALTYSELAARMPEAGGEYVYLRKTFGPLWGFLSGWVSLIAGFSAPAAIAAFLSADYLTSLLKAAAPDAAITAMFVGVRWSVDIFGWDLGVSVQQIYAIALIVLFSLFHGVGVKKGGWIQNALTLMKLIIVILFLVGGLTAVFMADGPVHDPFRSNGIQWGGVGIGLLWVLFAYSGWNGASYLAGEIENPEKNVPKAMMWGTLLTALLYVLINLMYFLASPASTFSGKTTVAAIISTELFGTGIAVFFNVCFCLILLSTLSAQVMIGPRVYYAMARDGLFFRFAGSVHPKFETPLYSIILQGLLSVAYILSDSYYDVMTYMGFSLSIFPFLTVLGLWKLRKNAPDAPYRVPYFPYTPLLFLIVSVIIIVTSAYHDWENALRAIAAVDIGAIIYFASKVYREEFSAR
ncbi:MAG: amino acid permease [Leptospiraceae bacterium]|nr:amino acid permease [Leptospiraceae bacterium]